jgi:cellulose synthase/poly-beta-1,6-N-acetylglucosamine synthase-like glycosyltransferase
MEQAAIVFGYSIAAALLVVGYAYAGYPVLVYLCSRLFGRKPQRPLVPDEQLPNVTLLIAAYNESRNIRERILNAQQLDYPRNKLEIIIASDGSSDETVKIAREYSSKGVRVIEFLNRRGKSAVLNDVIPHCRGEVIMFSDANTSTEPDSVRNLAAWFSDPHVGVVCGKLILIDPIKGRNVDSLYWKYETFLKTCEARLGALLGSNGGIYALRKVVYQEIPGDTIVDDFVIPLLAKERTGCRIVYDVEAVAYEETPSSIASEFQRRARIGAGGFQAITLLKGLLNPKHGWLSFAFFNHKVLRWLSPFFLGFALFGNLLWVAMCMPHIGNVFHLPWAALFLMCQVAFYASSLLSGMLPSRPKLFKIFRLSAMFTSMNAALAVGFWRWCRGKQNSAWKRTLREGEVAGAVNPLFDTKEHLAIGQETARTPQDTGIDLDPLPELPPPVIRNSNRVAS